MNDDDTAGSVAVALASLKGSVDTGFAKLDGRLDVALERQIGTEREIKELKRKLVQLETKMWKLSLTAALIGGGGATGAWQLMG
ncbi:hypothetical protein [Streptomyces cinereoruber]|uniref:hypothetical protein n=1 Tax=Streptomyces cinereoruber TaxID=67260 RepID=UPI00365476C8